MQNKFVYSLIEYRQYTNKKEFNKVVKIRLKRLGYKKNPFYRMVVVKDTTKRDIKNYNLASIKNSDINPVDYFVEVNLFNQKSFPSASNKFIDKFTNSFYDVFGSLEKRILLGKSDFRVIEDAKHQGVIYYANTSLDEVKTAIDNEDFEYMKQYQVCFSTDFLSKQEDTSIKLDINTKFIKIDYCNNFK